MHIILWRHAEAEPASGTRSDPRLDDLMRELTPRGHQQAENTAAWLEARLSADARVLVSPARRTLQTAGALKRESETIDALAPDASWAQALAAISAHAAHCSAIVAVGHQPTIGQLAHYLLLGDSNDLAFAKGSAWWFSGSMDPKNAFMSLRGVFDPALG